MNPSTLKKLIGIDKELRKRGELTFFAAFMRTDISTDNSEKFDLIFSAKWAKNSRKEREYIFAKLIRKFDPEALVGFLAKLHIVPTNDPSIEQFTNQVGLIVSKSTLKKDLKFGTGKDQFTVRKAFIFSSTPAK